jgi:hypothetical protein
MKIVRKNTRGYYGMNHEAGKQIGVKDVPPKGTIYVSKELKGRMLKRTIAHEKIESSILQRNPDMKYDKAHKIAMSFERNIK